MVNKVYKCLKLYTPCLLLNLQFLLCTRINTMDIVNSSLLILKFLHQFTINRSALIENRDYYCCSPCGLFSMHKSMSNNTWQEIILFTNYIFISLYSFYFTNYFLKPFNSKSKRNNDNSMSYKLTTGFFYK